MKKIILPALAILCFNIATAQTTTTTPDMTSPSNNIQAPSSVSTKFNTDYPNSTPAWSMEGNYYRAEYPDANTSMRRSVLYDRNGNVMSREEMIAKGAYPNTIGDYYMQNYPTENYDVWMSTDASGNKSYYSNRNSETIWFDKNGKYKTKKSRSTKSTDSKKQK